MKYLQAKDIPVRTPSNKIPLDRLLEIEDLLEVDLKSVSVALVPIPKIGEALWLAQHLAGNGFHTETFLDKGVPTVIVSRGKSVTVPLDQLLSVILHPIVLTPLLVLGFCLMGVGFIPILLGSLSIILLHKLFRE